MKVDLFDGRSPDWRLLRSTGTRSSAIAHDDVLKHAQVQVDLAQHRLRTLHLPPTARSREEHRRRLLTRSSFETTGLRD